MVETVLGVQFDPVRGLTNAHLGAFWASLGLDWPRVSDVPPLGDQFEQFGTPSAWSGMRLQVSQDPSARLQIRNEAGNRMIQAQNRRLHYNWVRQEGAEYPRYSRIRPEFDETWKRFVAFLRDSRLDAPAPNQWEVTYVNHFPRNTVWSTPSDWSRPFRGSLAPLADMNGTVLASVRAYWQYEIQPQRGRLHVEVTHGFVGNEPPKKEALIVKLTARGPVNKERDADSGIDEGLNLGHDTIVQGFRDMTSDEAHKCWEIQE